MVNPAILNGHIRIANELVEQFARINITGNEWRIIWVVWRKTWGWAEGERRKDWDWISLSQFERMTEMKHSNCVKKIKSLVAKRILLKKDNMLKFNQNYEDWVVSKRILGIQKDTGGGIKTDIKGVYKRIPTKETITKETTTKERKTIVPNPAFQLILTKWNDFQANDRDRLPKVLHLSDSRIKKLKARLVENQFDFDAILQAIDKQEWLFGNNDRGWCVSFDWLIENNTNYLKVLELKYENLYKKGERNG